MGRRIQLSYNSSEKPRRDPVYARLRRWRPTNPFDWSGKSLIVAGIIALGVVLAAREAVFFDHRTAIVTVCDKEPYVRKNGGEYRVYAPGNKTFVIKDTHAFTQWRINSADAYGRLREQRTYKVTYVGFRFKLRSWFPNITSFERVETSKPELNLCDT
jgi:hypothetical protein